MSGNKPSLSPTRQRQQEWVNQVTKAWWACAVSTQRHADQQQAGEAAQGSGPQLEEIALQIDLLRRSLAERPRAALAACSSTAPQQQAAANGAGTGEEGGGVCSRCSQHGGCMCGPGIARAAPRIEVAEAPAGCVYELQLITGSAEVRSSSSSSVFCQLPHHSSPHRPWHHDSCWMRRNLVLLICPPRLTTRGMQGAGTRGGVDVELFGCSPFFAGGSTGRQRLAAGGGARFAARAVDTFDLWSAHDVGHPVKLHLWLSAPPGGRGRATRWLLAGVRACRRGEAAWRHFPCHDWVCVGPGGR